MRRYFESDFFGRRFEPRFGGMSGPSGCPFRGDFPGHHGPSTSGPFGPRFDHSPDRREHNDHGPEHRRRGPLEDGHRGPRCGHHGSESDSDGPAERHCHGPPSFRGRDGRHHDLHGHGPRCHNSGPRFGRNPVRSCFGRRGPSEFPWTGPWEGPWDVDRHMRSFGHGHHGPFGHRKRCPYDSEERPSRKADCEKCRENHPCCSSNKENRGREKGRKGNGPCCDKDKDQSFGDTVFVQRIVLEKATRPKSI